ncbi:MAG: DUF4316 domain-containing protein [Acidaminococcaceae bacterium]|nr:DUF4316 domain-containing protein [Acidaminococcaceae bacterium]
MVSYGGDEDLPDNSYAIYQLKDGSEFHMLRFASMDELTQSALRLRRDVHQVLEASDDIMFQDKASAEQYLRDQGFTVIPNADPEFITVRNAQLQEATIYLTYASGICWLEGCDTRGVDQSVKREHYDLVYTGFLPEAGAADPLAFLESLYAQFNLDPPEDFRGHSLSVSDVIVLRTQEAVRSYYTDSFGFRELPGFLPENALRNAEMAMEDDYDMIDGIINNGPKQEKQRELPAAPERENTPHEGHQKAHRRPDAPAR